MGVEPTSTGLQPVAWPSGASVKRPRQESNLIPDLRRVVCTPPHSEDKKSRRLDSHQHGAVYGTAAFLHRATSAMAEQAAHRFELCRAALETACSPRSTLLFKGVRGESNPPPRLSQGRMQTTTPQTPSTSSPGWI